MTSPDSEAIQVNVEDVIANLTSRIAADAHEIAGLRALAKQQAAEIARLGRVNAALRDDDEQLDGSASS